MGTSHSQEVHRTDEKETVYSILTRKCESKFEPLDVKTIKETFRQLATPVGDSEIWTEETFVKFLELPDDIGSLLFLSASYVAAYPYTTESPAILTYDAMIRTVAIMMDRVDGIISVPEKHRLLYDSFAVLENRSQVYDSEPKGDRLKQKIAQKPGPLMRRSDLRKLTKFLLCIQEKSPLEVVSHYIDHFQDPIAEQMDESARSICQSGSVTETVQFEDLAAFAKQSPGLLKSLASLYAHFLYPSKATGGGAMGKLSRPSTNEHVLNHATAAQLAMFLPRELVYGKLDALYRASKDGFSMGSFETKVLRYPGPTVLLIDGHLEGLGKARFGLFSRVPWKASTKETFGDEKTILFQLLPCHKVFDSSQLRHLAWFSKSAGLGVGCEPPSPTRKTHDYGALSLTVDTSLEYATFRQEESTDQSQKMDIREVEVWGLGGDREAQRRAWEWEEAEANRRRTVNVKDMQADYGNTKTDIVESSADTIRFAGNGRARWTKQKRW